MSGRWFQFVSHIGSECATRFRALLAGFTGVQCGTRVQIARGGEVALGPIPARRGAILLGDRTRLDRGVILHPYGGRIETGIDVYIGPYTVIYGHGGVVVGKDTLISMHCRILSSNHTIPAPGTIIRSQPDVALPTCIGRDVWLGAGVTVLGGVTIGDGCIVGAGAVVSESLPANSIAIGVPARVLRQRA
jgi:acetyltransferase-like isoleucine patch superfamily enzyme